MSAAQRKAREPVPPPVRTTLLALFFLSGATGLIYEVVWARLLTLSFGSTILATSTVLTAFMGGLALGAVLVGRWTDAVRRPVRLYALLELLIGVYALATPWLFARFDDLYIALHGAGPGGFWWAALLRFGLALVLLLPPTLLMGGTLPVLARLFMVRRPGTGGPTLSTLYAVNTFGAVAGTLAAGLLLIELLGVRALLIVCGVAGLVIAAVALALDRRCSNLPGRRPSTDVPPGWSSTAWLAALGLGVSGAAALIYEVAWARVLTLVIGSSTYAFTLMLATFLVGIAAGSTAIRPLTRSPRHAAPAFVGCQVLIGILAVLTAAAFASLPDLYVQLYALTRNHFGLLLGAQMLLAAGVMLPATLCMGAAFPLAGALAIDRDDDGGRRVGLLYAANTCGAILGAFLAGFALLPGIGIRSTLMLAVFLNLGGGLVLAIALLRILRAPRMAVPALVAAGAILCLVFLWQPTWDTARMTSGPHAYAPAYLQTSIDTYLEGGELLFYREGPTATVSVNRRGAEISLAVDGKTDASNLDDMSTQVLLAAVPMLLAPGARDVLVVGFASGITAGVAGRFPAERIDCGEIEPAMREARAFFTAENYDILADERFTLTIDDARAFFRTTPQRYDVIISEPSNPWLAGSSRLFTREALAGARRILRPGGVMAQWMHLYWMDIESVAMVVRTFRSVFPHATLWMDPEVADLILVGSDRPIVLNPIAVQEILDTQPGVAGSLERIGYAGKASILRAFALGEQELERFAGAGALHVDDRPLLEYRAPRNLHAESALGTNIEIVRSFQAPESLPRLAIPAGQQVEAAALLSDWGRHLAEQQSLANARGALHAVTWLVPDNPLRHIQLGHLRAAAADPAGAIESFESALELDPELGEACAELGALHYQQQELETARDNIERAIALGEDSANIRNNLAVVLAEMRHYEAATVEFERALEFDPTNELARTNLVRIRRYLDANR